MMTAALDSDPDVRLVNPAEPLALRRFPYPYNALFALCSDLDETPGAAAYFELMRFLNTTESTSMGPGIGLEVGNTIYFDMPPGHFSYWNAAEADRARIRLLIQSGHIDCLHSFGDLAATRAHAERALDELDRYACRLRVWVDHAVAPTNFGADIMHGHGDDPSHPAYHADLSSAHGIRYISRGRCTSVIGQDQPLDLSPLFSSTHPVRSASTILKEAVKQALARGGAQKYAIHAPNRVMQEIRLRDGRHTIEFLRCNPHWGGVSCGDRGDAVHEVLTSSFLTSLEARQGSCILYTHLGKLGLGNTRFSVPVVVAFRLLAEAFHQGRILVTSTSRLLEYLHMRDHVSVSCARHSDGLDITVSSLAAAGSVDFSGLTVYVPSDLPIRSFAAEAPLEFVRNPSDKSGRASITVPFVPRPFPSL